MQSCCGVGGTAELLDEIRTAYTECDSEYTEGKTKTAVHTARL